MKNISEKHCQQNTSELFALRVFSCYTNLHESSICCDECSILNQPSIPQVLVLLLADEVEFSDQ